MTHSRTYIYSVIYFLSKESLRIMYKTQIALIFDWLENSLIGVNKNRMMERGKNKIFRYLNSKCKLIVS